MCQPGEIQSGFEVRIGGAGLGEIPNWHRFGTILAELFMPDYDIILLCHIQNARQC